MSIHKLKIAIIILAIAVGALYTVAGIAVLLNTKQPAKAPQTAQKAPEVAKIVQDPQLQGDAEALGIDVTGLNLLLQPKVSTDASADGNAVGLFTKPNTIEIGSSLPHDQQLYTFAHEFMHYRWTIETESQRQAIAPSLLSFYKNDAGFQTFFNQQQYSKDYLNDAANLLNELDSFECAQVNPTLLPQSINDYCNANIPNRALLFD